MLNQVAEGVLVHESEFFQSNAVVVQGRAGVLLIDPGIHGAELVCLANDLGALGGPVVAASPRIRIGITCSGTPSSATRRVTARRARRPWSKAFLSNPNWKDDVAEELPPEAAEDIPLDLLGLIAGLPAGATRLPWDGPEAGSSSIRRTPRAMRRC